jgi:SpoVK/Ycf46/Vps4 family AAA+-type ATPase
VDNIQDLELLISTHHPIIAITSPEEDRVRERVRELAAKVTLPFFEWKSTQGLLRIGTSDPLYQTEKPLVALQAAARMQTEAVYLFHDLQKYFEDPTILRATRDLGFAFAKDRRVLIVCAPQISIPPDLQTCTALLHMELPGIKELKHLMVRTLRNLGAPKRIKVDLTLPEIEQLVQQLRGLTLAEAQRVLMSAALDDLRLDRKDFKHILERKKKLIASDGLLQLHAQEETLKQIGGLDNLKKWLKTRGAAFSPEARRYGLEAPRGLMLLGVQGCGKSLCAKAVASEWGLALLRLDAGSLYDKYVGESEKNLRRSLKTAEAMAPCVLWIDEIEKAMPGSEGGSADGGLSRRIFGAFLSWMQEKKQPVFVAATANNIDSVPPELLRKGRFDEIFFVDLPDDAARRSILAVHLSRRKQSPRKFDLTPLSAASEGFSGSEIEAAIVSALYTAFAERKTLETHHIMIALRATVPLSRTCREAIQSLRAWARNRTVPASGQWSDIPTAA